LAKIIMAQKNDDIDFIASKYLNENVPMKTKPCKAHEILLPNGLTKIFLFEKICDDFFNEKRNFTKVVKTKKDDEAAQKFNQYFDWSEPFQKHHHIDY
jgi:uncharacterized protein